MTLKALSPLVIALFLAGCTPKYYQDSGPKLAIVNIIDQNDLTETISTQDRIRQFENTDFLSCQPYKKVMRIYQRDCEGNVKAYLTSYHSNGQPWQYVEVLNGRANGTFMEWYPSGTLKVSAYVIGGEADITQGAQKSWLFDGLSTVWDDEGNKIAELPYSKGLLDGLCLYYHPSGALWKKIPMCQGKKEGEQAFFLENGSLLSRAYFVNDEPSGPTQKFWPNDTLAADECFENGKLLQGVYWDRCGKEISRVTNGNGKRVLFGKENVSSVQTFVNGLAEGKVENYTKEGRLANYYHQKEGLKHGDEVHVYPGTLTPKLLMTFRTGKLQGPSKTWYRNGQLESQKELSDNKKNGLLTAWYQDGSLMLIEEYNQDKLSKGEYYRRGEKLPVSEILRGNGTATLFDGEGNFLRRVSYLNGEPDAA